MTDEAFNQNLSEFSRRWEEAQLKRLAVDVIKAMPNAKPPLLLKEFAGLPLTPKEKQALGKARDNRRRVMKIIYEELARKATKGIPFTPREQNFIEGNRDELIEAHYDSNYPPAMITANQWSYFKNKLDYLEGLWKGVQGMLGNLDGRLAKIEERLDTMLGGEARRKGGYDLE